MKTTLNQRNIRITMVFLTVGIIFGLLYPISSREFDDPVAFVNGLTIGILGSIFLSLSELYIYNPLNRNMKFIRKVTIKTLFYTGAIILIILLVFSVNRSIYNQVNYIDYVQGEEFYSFVFQGDFHVIVIYTLFLSAALIFAHQISNKMGQGVLLNLIFGKYHKPKEEDRIFMFLDLNDSTTLAEKMGATTYNQFLNEFYSDITDAILNANGRIYRYVGDEVTITWPMKRGLKNAVCIQAYFSAKKSIQKLEEKYQVKYHCIPRFTAGLHCGKVVVGQVGDVKSQIIFNGRILYEGTQIEKMCKATGHNILISAQLMSLLNLPTNIIKKQVPVTEGTYKLPDMDLYTVLEDPD